MAAEDIILARQCGKPGCDCLRARVGRGNVHCLPLMKMRILACLLPRRMGLRWYIATEDAPNLW